MSSAAQERWRQERRGRLLAGAARVFARTPYAAASMDEIAAEAGVGKPTLYRYFPGKSLLFEAVFADALTTLEARLDRVLDEERDIERRLRGLVAAMIPTFRAHLVPARLVDGEAPPDGGKRRIFREHRARLAGCLAAAIEDGIRRGELREVEAANVAHLIIGMVWSGTASLPAPDEEIARQIVDLVLGGIRAAEHRAPAASWAAGAPARRLIGATA